MNQHSSDSTDHIWCVIPVFNNKDTVKSVARQCRRILPNVVVVDDGSTDTDVAELFRETGVPVLQHGENLGKGKAIMTGLRYVKERGGRYMITIDADGQHIPADLEKFIPLLQNDGPLIVVGCRKFGGEHVPRKSHFGRKLSNFWLRVEAGISIADCQSGFRSYPVKYLSQLKLKGSFYDFETEVLTKAAWAGLKFKSVEVDVHYPEPHHRVSSFRPFLDNLRISHMHVCLVFRRLLPIPHKRLVPVTEKAFDSKLLRHPIKFMKTLLNENATPGVLALSAAVGTFLGVLPLISVHTLVIIYVSTRLHLNKVMALAIQNLCMPPLVPAICVELGYYMRHGKWLTEISFHTIFKQLPQRLLDWVLGSLIVAPVLAVIVGIIVYIISRALRKRTGNHGTN
jgi:glycosyltransferase involved in cell wall biosynthesis